MKDTLCMQCPGVHLAIRSLWSLEQHSPRYCRVCVLPSVQRVDAYGCWSGCLVLTRAI